MAADRQAVAIWHGDLLSGSDVVSDGTSKIFALLPVTWASHTGFSDDKASFEELVAIAAGFQKAVGEARDGFPISQALEGNVALSVEAILEK